MALTKEQKKDILADMETAFANSQSCAFVNFHGLPVSDTTELRNKLREEGIGYRVVKKTLLKLALQNAKIEGEVPELEGEIAVAYADDLTGPARETFDFAKKHKNTFSLVGGVFEGVLKNKEEMTEIAAIPPIEVLRGMFVNVINSPIQGLVVALGAVAEKKDN